MLMKSYPGKRNPSQSKLRSVLLQISNNVLPAIQIKLLSRTWRLNRSHSLPASFHVLMEKSLSFCLQFRDAHEGSTVPLRKQKTTKTALSVYKTFFPGLLPKVSLLKKSLFSISQSADSFVSCPKTLSS